MKTRDLVRAHIAGHRERVMREAVFRGRLLSDGKGRFVTGENVYADGLSYGAGEVKVAIPTLDSEGRAPGCYVGEYAVAKAGEAYDPQDRGPK